MNPKVVLDSSAILALLQEENGSEVVKPLINYAVMSSVNISEVLTLLGRNGINLDEALILIKDILHDIAIFDLGDASLSADLKIKLKNKGLSLGDCACIALGVKMKLPIYTADKIWADLKLEGPEIILIR
jgi:PIN domain nuclease of toxin-antitoxin system